MTVTSEPTTNGQYAITVTTDESVSTFFVVDEGSLRVALRILESLRVREEKKRRASISPAK